jgi:[methyl-Co(III) methanol-specific corrinoid protein]:coenzyme M methyltransferase
MPYFSVVQEAAAFGCEIDWGTSDTLPTQRSHAFSEPDDFKMPVDFLDRLPIKTVIDSIRLLKKKHPDALIIGKVMGPWTLSYHLYGMENFLMDTITERERTLGFLNAFKQVSTVFAEAQFEAGADVVTIADHATADLVSPLAYKDLLLPIHRELNKTVSVEAVMAKKPEMIIREAVWGMLPKGRLGRAQYAKLKVYAGAEHPHAAQNPELVKF